jgi:RNA polymerase sigma-70 factor, ECF subfamily
LADQPLGYSSFKEFFEISFDSFFGPLHRYAFTLLKDSELASEAVQTTFIKWWENQTVVNGQLEAKRYLFTAVYRNSINLIRDERVKKSHATIYNDERETTSEFHDVMGYQELDSKIKMAIEMLPAQCKTIFCMSRFEEMKYSEIASSLNLSIKTVEAQMTKALKVLREKLDGYAQG